MCVLGHVCGSHDDLFHCTATCCVQILVSTAVKLRRDIKVTWGCLSGLSWWPLRCVVSTEIHSRPALATRWVSNRVRSRGAQAGVSLSLVSPGKQKQTPTLQLKSSIFTEPKGHNCSFWFVFSRRPGWVYILAGMCTFITTVQCS